MFPQIIGAIEIPDSDNVEALSNSFLYHAVYFIHMVLVIPMLEEIVFRKVMFKQLALLKPIWIILVSSLLFSFIHINPFAILGSLRSVIGVFVFAIVAGVIYYYSGKLSYTIVVHSVTNVMSYLIKINHLIYFDIQRSLNYNLIYWLIIVASLFVCIFLLKIVCIEKK